MIYFISGHRDATYNEFEKHYIPKIIKAISQNASFVVGDCEGIDYMAQQFLKDNNVKNVKVYHISNKPQYNVGYPTISNFQSDFDRDFQMTLDSNEDILWIRKGKESSGTACNIDRRIKYNSNKLSKSNLISNEAERFL